MVCYVVYVVCTYTPDWSSTIRVLPPRLTQVHWAGSILLMSTISVAVDLWDSEGPSDFRKYYQYYLQNILSLSALYYASGNCERSAVCGQ